MCLQREVILFLERSSNLHRGNMHVNIGGVYLDKQKPDLPIYRYEKDIISQL